MFYDRYLACCKEKGVSPSTLALELGIGKGAYTQWKNGSEPTIPTKKKIADYFGLTIAELENGKIKEPATEIDDGLSPIHKEFFNFLKQLPPDEAEIAYAYLKGRLDARK